MTETPERIGVSQTGDHWICGTWAGPASGSEYVRADLLTAALAREAGLREALRHIAKHWPDSFAARHARAALAVMP